MVKYNIVIFNLTNPSDLIGLSKINSTVSFIYGQTLLVIQRDKIKLHSP